MPITIGTYKCLACEGEFEATSVEFRECGCGRSAIKLFESGYGYRWQNDTSEVELVVKKTYYLKDEFLPMTDKMKSLIDEIKEMDSRVKHFYNIYFAYESDLDGGAHLRKVSLSYYQTVCDYSSEMNLLEANIEFLKNYDNSVESVEHRLEKLVTLMRMISFGELDFSNRKKMLELSEKMDIGYGKEQLKEYDYTFYV